MLLSSAFDLVHPYILVRFQGSTSRRTITFIGLRDIKHSTFRILMLVIRVVSVGEIDVRNVTYNLAKCEWNHSNGSILRLTSGITFANLVCIKYGDLSILASATSRANLVFRSIHDSSSHMQSPVTKRWLHLSQTNEITCEYFFTMQQSGSFAVMMVVERINGCVYQTYCCVWHLVNRNYDVYQEVWKNLFRFNNCI